MPNITFRLQDYTINKLKEFSTQIYGKDDQRGKVIDFLLANLSTDDLADLIESSQAGPTDLDIPIVLTYTCGNCDNPMEKQPNGKSYCRICGAGK